MDNSNIRGLAYFLKVPLHTGFFITYRTGIRREKNKYPFIDETDFWCPLEFYTLEIYQ